MPDTSNTTTAEPATQPPQPASLSLAATIAPLLVLAAVVLGCGGMLAPRIGGPATALIAVWCAPLLSLIGAILAFLGLRRITASDGAVVGKPMGILGLFLGIAVTVGLVAAALMSAAMLAGSHRLAPEVARLTIAAQDARFTDARGALSISARNSLDDPDLTRFVEDLRRELGSSVTTASAGLDLLDAGRDALARAPAADDAEISVEEMPRPLWLHTGADRHLTYGWVDEQALHRQHVKIKDLLVLTPHSTVLILRRNGPARSLANKLGWPVANTPPPDPPEQPDDATDGP